MKKIAFNFSSLLINREPTLGDDLSMQYSTKNTVGAFQYVKEPTYFTESEPDNPKRFPLNPGDIFSMRLTLYDGWSRATPLNYTKHVIVSLFLIPQ